MGLVLIARFYQILATPEGLAHQFAPAVKNLGEPARFGDQELLLAAKSLGFWAKATTLSLKDIDNAILPALCQSTSGEYFILVQSVLGSGGPSAIAKEASAEEDSGEVQYLIHNLIPTPGPRKVTAEELTAMWDGRAILLSPRRSPFFGVHCEFNLKWFISSLIKYRRLLGEVCWLSF